MLVCLFRFFQFGMFVDVKTFHDKVTPEWKLLSVSISGVSILYTILNPGLIKQFNNGINIT